MYPLSCRRGFARKGDHKGRPYGGDGSGGGRGGRSGVARRGDASLLVLVDGGVYVGRVPGSTWMVITSMLRGRRLDVDE